MHNFLARLDAQRKANVGISSPIMASKESVITSEYEKPCAAKPNDEPLPPSELAFYLNKLEEKTKNMSDPNSITFDNIQSFCSWYSMNISKFSDKQVSAFNSLEDAKNRINQGCGCRTHVRQKMADDYYKLFFVNNQATDLIPAIKQAAGTNLIIFKLGTEEFLRI